MIALDTNLFVYVLEGNAQFAESAARVLHKAQGNGVASMLVYAELLSAPVFASTANRSTALAFMNGQALRYMELTKEVLIRAAELRSCSLKRHGLGDAPHLACALQAGADTFITNDQGLLKVKVPGLAIEPVAE